MYKKVIYKILTLYKAIIIEQIKYEPNTIIKKKLNGTKTDYIYMV